MDIVLSSFPVLVVLRASILTYNSTNKCAADSGVSLLRVSSAPWLAYLCPSSSYPSVFQPSKMRSSFRLLPSLLILSQQNFAAIADPLPLPEALPAPDAYPQPTGIALEVRTAEAFANPEAEAVPQNYYAFSGAVYIVGAGGQTLNAASPAYCPNQAPQGCGNIGVYNW